jgi:hypothetical protein
VKVVQDVFEDLGGNLGVPERRHGGTEERGGNILWAICTSFINATPHPCYTQPTLITTSLLFESVAIMSAQWKCRCQEVVWWC